MVKGLVVAAEAQQASEGGILRCQTGWIFLFVNSLSRIGLRLSGMLLLEKYRITSIYKGYL